MIILNICIMRDMIVENNPDMLQDYQNGGHIILTETDHYAVVKTVRSAEKDD